MKKGLNIMGWNLKTDRLLLREINEENLDFLMELKTRPETNKYENGGIPSNDSIIEHCHLLIEKAELLPEEGAIMYAVYNAKDEMIGDVHLNCNWKETGEWEIGYGFLCEYWGNGYATEAVKTVIEFAFKKLHIHKLMAFINAENIRSVALAKRIGMVQEGHMREGRLVDGKWNDEFVFTLLKTDLK